MGPVNKSSMVRRGAGLAWIVNGERELLVCSSWKLLHVLMIINGYKIGALDSFISKLIITYLNM